MSEIKVFHFNVFSLVPQLDKPYETYVQSQKRGFQQGHREIMNLYKVFTKDIGIAERDVQVRMTGRLANDETVSNLVIRNYRVGDVADMLDAEIRMANNLQPRHVAIPVPIRGEQRVIVFNTASQNTSGSVSTVPKQIADASNETRVIDNTLMLSNASSQATSSSRQHGAVPYEFNNRPDLTKQYLDPRDALYPGTNYSLNDEQADLYIKTWIGSDTDNVINAASYSCRPTCVKKILELGATVDHTTKHGMKQNVLELALSSYYGTLEDRKKIVDLAIKRGVDLNQKVNYCGSDVTLCEMMDSKIRYLNDYWDGTRCVEPGANDAKIQMYQALKAYLVQCGAK